MKLRNLMGAVLALAGVAFCGTAAGGDVWEFIPDSPTGTNYTAGTTVQFRMRVLTRNYEGPADDLAPFMKTPNFDNYTVQAAFLADPVHAAETLNADYPLQIGVVANGKTVGAKLVTSNVTNDNLATDFVFAYTVQTGDYALPLRLAADANGNPINSGASTSKFFFLYGPGSGNEIWSIKATTRPVPGVESETFTFDPQMVSQGTSETEVMKREVIPYNKDGDYLRASFRFDLETLEFDGESETGDDGKDYWRVVCGNDSKPFAPRIQTIDGLLPLTGGQKVYIWVAPSGGDDDDLTEWNWPADEEADYAVAIPAGANVLKKAKFTDPDGQEREHNVYVITLAAGTPTYSFPLEGKHVGETARIVLSSSPHWNKVGSTGDWIATDFRVQTVYCGEQKPSISVTDVDGNVKVAVEATTNYTASTMMKIHFDVPYAAGPVTVTLRQKLGDAFVPSDDNFISNRYFSILAEPDGDPAVQPSLERITMPAGQQDVYFYVFALGATADTKNPGLTLVPDVSDQSEEIRAFFAAGNHRSALLKITDQVPVPSVSAPTSGFSQDMIGVDVTVADNWRDLSTYNTNGYKVVIKLGGQAVCETNGVKFSEGDAQSFAVKIPMEGHPLKGQVQVWDVTHGNTYGVAEFEIDAEAALTAKPAFYPDSASTNAYPEGYFYTEGMSPFLRVNLTSEAKDDMWAFLVPLNEAASNLVECAAYSNGLFIAKGARSSDTATITFLDGYTEKNPMRALFTVDLRSHEKIDAEGSVSYTSTYDPQKVTLSCVNVPSTVTAVKLDTESIKTGGTFYNVPAMIDKTFRAKVADLSEIDLKYGEGYEGKEIWVRFEYTDDWNGWEQAPSKNLYATNGLNNYAEMNVAFTYEGTVQRVNVYALDKDSRAAGVEMDELEWGDPLFTFYVSVSAPQRIIIHDKQKKAITDEDELVYSEDQMQVLAASSGDFYISLSAQPGSGTPAISKANPIRVKVTLEQYGDGCLDIQTNYVYYTTPADMALKPIRINTATLNGGRESVWWMTAEVDMEDPSATDADGNPWNEHFAAASCMVRVENVDPVIDQATAKGARMAWSEDGTNSVTVGEAITVSWTISDITNDFYKAEWKDEGFQIAWGNVDGVEGGNPLTITNDWPRKKGIGSMGKIYGESKFQVPDRTGAFPITMTVTDGDGGSATKEWWVYVAPSKRAKINVYGPRATAESKYKAAKGVGQGLVAAKGTITLCEQFAQTWEYDETTADAEFYAFGYPATNTWAQFVAENPGSGASADDTFDDGKIPGYLGYSETLHGVPLNKLGNYVSKPDTATVYYDWATHGGRDPDAGRYDSYFYRWMVTKAASEDKGGDTEPAAPAPTLWPFDGTSKTFSLDSGNGENKSGPVTYGTVGIEAIFSRELRERDNLGDINADGIPDKIVELYGLGAEEVGKIPEDDLASLSAFNEDEDFLPNTAGAAIYSSLIPGLPGSWGEGLEFTARMEVRGFHDGLNDGAKLAGLSQYRFDADYDTVRDYSDVEQMAWAEHGYAKDWSPERPTDPTKEDTDEDKFPDGYEYYFWYKAHVGYMENGVHRYLTGRAYDPRNPGEGKFISAATIARMMDPRSDLAPVDFPEGYIDDASDAKTRDTDNDGLPDALEFEIGTNPFDFDTDGDGLPDGFEIMLGGTDPLLAETTKGVSDAMRNFDGDAMAFTTPYLEANEFVLPVPLHVDTFQRFALVDETGDTDGIQWYVGRTAPTNIIASAETFSGVSFTLTDRPNVTYVTSRTTLPVVDGRLACDLLKSEVRTMISTNDDFGVEGDVNIALMPVLIRAGTPVTNVSETVVEYRTLALAEDLENASTAWVYGRSVTAVTTGDSLANLGGFGMLAIGRYQTAKAGLELAALPAEDDGVAYLHHFVYQEFGFDPRTAWNANTPLAPRWGKTVTTGAGETESTETVANNYTANYGYAGVATRTREYTLYDEFLVMSFFLNNGKLSEADVTPTQAMPWEKIWSKYTTNGQGPNEPNWEEDNEHFKGRTAETNSGTNGADTDMDGVPDGWELYVMAGPKVEDKETKEFKYNFAAPYNDGFYSSFGPFVKDAAKASVTDNSATGGNASTAGDGDGLTELQEYAGTDSCAYYSEPWGGNEAPFSTTIVRPAEHKDWLNKFFPTDPWNKDTDGDGLTDSAEAGKFKYGKPVDDGKRCAISGGGLNPCTVDTDMDGLPDGWEAQFAGKTVYAGADAQKPKDKDGNEVADGNVLQGYCDGMDGTVPDAFNTPHINTSTGSEAETEVIILNGIAQVVDRDYDKDGLDNWQEYMTGAMRVWRYDDPRSSFDWSDKAPADKSGAIVPDGAFFDDLGNFNLASAMLYTGITDPDEFWYRTLFDRESKWYNPHFITGTAPGTEYFSRVTNGWDQAFTEAGSYYIFFDRQNDQMYKDTWDYMGAAPTKYICTSPIDADTDQDGMDDGYELFHGLNPLLGAAGVLKSSNGPCDIVFDAWYVRPVGSPVDALNNNWTTGLIPTDFDFTVNPWLNGLVDADPDGDDIRNQDEAIMPLVAPSQTWFHTDPTPLWMTDSSYDDSLVTRFFRMPNALGAVPVPEKVEFDGKTFLTRDLDGYMELPLIGPAIAPFTLKYWDVPLAYAPNWMYSFEENEGYDTDHDAGSDFEELQGKVRRKTDPQDADSPRRRQAMYFPGPAEPSALQSMPFVHELYPRAASGYPDDLSFLQYTVECWVRPESTADATVLERTSYVHPSHVADERYVRRNFAIMIRSGKWCTEFDANGTLDASTVRVLGKTDVEPGKWTYVAATYDANNLILYVNGIEDGRTASSLKPEYGSSAVVVYPAGSTVVSTNNGAGAGADIVQSGDHSYWFDSAYSLNAFLVGASFTNGDGRQLDVTAGMGFAGRYADFFTGYVDEIRVWDGAQSADVISANHAARKRYTREDAIANRNAFYDEWVSGKLRYRKDGSGKDMDVIPELRFHWTFDSLPGAENAARVLKAPHGFLDQAKPVGSRPSDYEVPWWSGIVGAYKSVYAGERNCWVPWIPNTVTHLPRFDGSTLDSAYWSEDAAGDEPGIYRFARTAEPVSKWTQMVRNLTESSLQFQTGNRRYWHSYNTGTNGTSMLSRLFEFTGRHLNQTGDDLLPLGGAFAKYVDTMWDDQGASTLWEQTGVDIDNDGLPDWWQEYAEQNYRKDGVPPEGVDITWDTVINYNVGGATVRITAGEAYLRDLAKGTYLDEGGQARIGPTDYIQTADEDANGIPDWWAEMYGIRGESGLADHDNDGLPNYVEYLLSEVFAFETLFDPTVPDSVRRGIPDYFYRPEGCQLYVGEIFTDHDLVDDAWEDLYDKKDQLDDEIYASRLAWDAFADTDEDGWSNRSENRYAKMVMPIVANEKAHYTPADGLVADYPIPTLSLRLRYNGNRQNAVSKAPIAVQVTTDATLARDPDATYLIGAVDEKTPGTGTTSDKESAGAGMEVARTRTIGKWSDRRVIGTLTPGNIKIDSIRLQNCYDPSSTTYSWTITGFVEIFRGTRAEYDDALRKYGSDNVKLVSATAGYKDLQDLKLTSDEKSIVATWTTKTGDTLGTVNLVTGEFSLDLGVFKGWTVFDSSDTNRTESTSMEDQTYRIAYATNPSVGLPRELYLGEADTGHVKEGKNSIVAWAETVAADGVWQPGEPYGIVRDVDVSWRGTSAEIELTDMSPVTPRIDLVADDAMPRLTRADIRERIEAHPDVNTPTILKWLDGNPIADRTAEGESFRGQRVRVVRWMINDVPVFLANTDAKVVLDKTIETDVRSCLTEADFLVGNESFDIDWDDLSDVLDDVREACGIVTNVSYLVVIGDGDADWNDFDTSNTVYALNTVITRKFGRSRVKPVAVAPGATGEEIVRSANPTFKWTMACPEEEGYTAFRIQVTNVLGEVVYDSDLQSVPPRNDKSQYVWSAPLFVGDRTLTGKVFENKKVYGWKVAMYNAKFSQESNAGYNSGSASFFMEVQTNGYDYGSANVAVRYFGPTETWTAKNPVIRVRAYTSPDFTGLPVAAGYVAAPDDPANGLLAGTNAAPNCTVVGIPRGTYYLQAFIDSNGNGACDPWETQGYLCTRDGSKPDSLDPTAITFDSKIGKGDLAIIYLEDADTDGDGLPDAWEVAVYGSLAAKGTELLTETKAGEFVVNTALSGALDLQKNARVPTAGLAGEIGSRLGNMSLMALAMNVQTEGYESAAAAIEAALTPELEEGGVSITELGLNDGKVTIALSIATTSGAESPLAKFFDTNGKLTVVCEILWTPTLAQEPKVIYTKDVVVGDEPVEFDISEAIEKAQKEAGVSGDSAFFSAKVHKK